MKPSQTVVVFALLVAGCGGSETGFSGGTTYVSPPKQPIEILREEALRLAAEIQAVDPTPGAGTPDVGTAQFDGIATFGILAESSLGEGIGGDIVLLVNFADDSFVGRINGFYSRDGDAREGAFTITDGFIGRGSEGVLLGANLEGSLEILSEVRDFDGGMLGAFAGETAQYAGGQILIESEFEVPSTDLLPLSVEGAFLVER